MKYVHPASVNGWFSVREGAKLFSLAAGKSVLEIGAHQGRSTICAAQSAKSVAVADPFNLTTENNLQIFNRNTERYKVAHKISPLHQAKFIEVAHWWNNKRLYQGKAGFDLVHIDGGHDPQQVIDDLDRVRPFLSPGATIVLHDYGAEQWPGVKIACDFMFGRAPDELVDSLAVFKCGRDMPGRKLNIITPMSRPELLEQVAASVGAITDWEVKWIVIADKDIKVQTPPDNCVYHESDTKSRFGNSSRNLALDLFVDRGWVAFLDDDNAVHPDYPAELWKILAENGKSRGVLVSQIDNDGKIRARAAAKELNKGVDTAQITVHSDLIKDNRWDLEAYDADGRWIRRILSQNASSFRFVDKPLVYYNRLRPK